MYEVQEERASLLKEADSCFSQVQLAIEYTELIYFLLLQLVSLPFFALYYTCY